MPDAVLPSKKIFNRQKTLFFANIFIKQAAAVVIIKKVALFYIRAQRILGVEFVS